MTQKPKPGDRVRLTLEGVARAVTDSGAIAVVLDGAPASMTTTLVVGELAAPTARVEVLDPPLKVGDCVRSLGSGLNYTGEILAIHGDWIWLGDEHGCGVLRRLSSCTRAQR